MTSAVGELTASDVAESTNPSAPPVSLAFKERRSGLRFYVPALLFLACLAAQLYLVYFKSFNWDEFLHFSQVYRLQAGTLDQPLQVLHSRILWWAPEVSANLLDQMRAARIFMWSMHLLTMVMIYGVARQFANAPSAFFAAFSYLTAGYVFTHGFSIRADPMVAATLMSALFLLARGPLGLLKAIVIGALIGLAGMMTLKAVFYAPCFAGLAWLKIRETPKKLQLLGKLVALAVAALLSFAAIYLYHTADLAEAATPARGASTFSHLLRWLSEGGAFANYIGIEVVLAPLFFIALLLAPLAWRKAGLKADAQIALAGFILPLAVLFFYRNTFPYFFVFILAPVAVAIAPALGLLRDRFGSVFLSLLLSLTALALIMLEPRDVLRRQQAMIDYVHREYPEKTGYLDYAGMIADYPRILRHLTSGNGIKNYHQRGDAIVAREIDRGNVPFIIANHNVIAAALEDQPLPDTFLPADLAAMKGNYVRQWGALWREGVHIPRGADEFGFELRRGGVFVVDGDTLTINGLTAQRGTRITLEKGRNLVSGGRNMPAVLWRGERLPMPPPDVPVGGVFTRF